MKIGSLFSGIGGLEKGLEMSGLGHTIWQVEKDSFCRSVLAKHWPQAERHSNVEDVGCETLEFVDLICGGFPCQDVSGAGKSKGLSGSRSGLWDEFARVLTELSPRWVVVENVTSGAKRWVDSVRADLERLGYETLPITLPAATVGAPHERSRVFIIAHAFRFPVRNEPEWLSWRRSAAIQGQGKAVALDDGCPGVTSGAPGWPTRPEIHTLDDGPANQLAHTAIGNAVVPQCAEVVGWIIRELGGL